MLCTLYSNKIGFDQVLATVRRSLPTAQIAIDQEDDFTIAYILLKGGFFSSDKTLKIVYRERYEPSYFLPDEDDSSLTVNLKGLYGYVNSLPTQNERIKTLFLQKIATLNSEFSIVPETGTIKELPQLIRTLAQEFDAILFVQPNTLIGKAAGQHFLDKDLNLLLDQNGRSEVEYLSVQIQNTFFDPDPSTLNDDQTQRKTQSEQLLQQYHIKINPHLPPIYSERMTIIRSPQVIAERVTALAITNLVAFDNLNEQEALQLAQEYGLYHLLTPKEKAFLANPTSDQKMFETWKVEGIWTLLWAINKVEDLPFPNELADLSGIASDNYPIVYGKNPRHFIASVTTTRPKSAILSANDLYYRLNWACTDARTHQQDMTIVNASVVYERHYALNWLINYQGQDWDEVSCDT